MRIIIAGSRNFTDYSYFKKQIIPVFKDLHNQWNMNKNEIEIVSGHARGADALGEQFADEYKIKCKTFPAKWDEYGNNAGPIRNQEMIDYISEEKNPILIAFLAEDSIGTKNIISLAEEKDILTFVCVGENMTKEYF